MRKVSAIVASLRETDVKSKGVGANAMPHSDLLNELLVKIFM
jgi:DNA polymerase-3 subunit delta